MTFEDWSQPMAIAMWDFSWLERRRPGGGYLDWNLALDELAERGYDCVRIDAFPHLVAAGAQASWRLLPVWDQHDWGSPSTIDVQVLPALTDFIALCAERGVRVLLSSWFRQDVTNARMSITSSEMHAGTWIRVLEYIGAEGLLGSIAAVDLCNEWTAPMWAPYLYDWSDGEPVPASRLDRRVSEWSTRALNTVRAAYPSLPLCFSFSDELENWRDQDVAAYDFLEPHIWMANHDERFYPELGYDMRASLFDPRQYDRLADRAAALYRSDPEHWKHQLAGQIGEAAEWSRQSGKVLVTTEGWALVNWKDGPGLDWGWIKDLCAFGVEAALSHGRWIGMATSNFCGPQFRGMWADVAWHQRLTAMIRSAAVPTVS